MQFGPFRLVEFNWVWHHLIMLGYVANMVLIWSQGVKATVQLFRSDMHILVTIQI